MYFWYFLRVSDIVFYIFLYMKLWCYLLSFLLLISIYAVICMFCFSSFYLLNFIKGKLIFFLNFLFSFLSALFLLFSQNICTTSSHILINVTDYDKKALLIQCLGNLKLKNNHWSVIGSLNINSISNKSGNLKLIVQVKIGILVITEIKKDSTFPLNQIAIQRYSKPDMLQVW